MFAHRYTAPMIAALTAIAMLGGCSSDKAGYPSLARRPAEQAANDPAQAMPAPAPLPAFGPAPAELTARLDTLVANARAAHERFRSRSARAEQLVGSASGSAVASEAWAVATVALADLESARSDAMVALADLDALLAADQVDHAVSGGGNASSIAAARDKVIAMVGEEDTALASLRGRMPS